VLLHGSGPGVTAHANWRTVLPALAAEFRCYAPDIVGFGYTDRPRAFAYGLDSWVAHLIGYLDALGIAKAHFIGNSFGGALTLAVASRFPERVDRLVLMGSAGLEFAVTPGLAAVWGYEPSREAMAAMMEYFAYDSTLITPQIVQSRFEASIRPGYHATYSAIFGPPFEPHVTALATPEEAIARIPHEALIVHGRDDRVIPLENSLRLNRLIDRSQLHVFGRCGHWTQIECAQRFIPLVANFLREA
jgi:pimeloyl-ACP methyl ester carboxylesterase